MLPASVDERLARLAADQRAAATAPPGPVLCIAPAGSGKTTTLVARIAWLVATGAEPSTIAAITFNRRAAEELRSRLDPALEPLGVGAGAVRVRTFHALGLEILRSAGRDVRLVARADLLARAVSAAGLPEVPATFRRLDDAFSRLKLDLRVTAAQVAGDPSPGPVARAFLTYQRDLAEASALDFDDLVVESLLALETDDRLLTGWRGRCGHLLVDEVQDVDASQLALALLLAAPANRIFLVGDDDQSIYGWRLADVWDLVYLSADCLRSVVALRPAGPCSNGGLALRWTRRGSRSRVGRTCRWATGSAESLPGCSWRTRASRRSLQERPNREPSRTTPSPRLAGRSD